LLQSHLAHFEKKTSPGFTWLLFPGFPRHLVLQPYRENRRRNTKVESGNDRNNAKKDETDSTACYNATVVWCMKSEQHIEKFGSATER
jgi:hypothetical protein